MKKLYAFLHDPTVRMILGVLIGTTMYCFAVVFISDLGSFYASGITGIAQLISTVCGIIVGKTFIGLKSILIALFNVPLFLIAWRGVSKKFAIVSLASVIYQVILIALFEKIRELGFNPFESLTDSVISLAIFGGLVFGVSEGISLKVGGSTGGMDVVSQYLSIKYHKSFSSISLIINLMIIICAAIIGYTTSKSFDMAAFTIIMLVVSILTMDKIFTIYKYSEITIISNEKDKIREALLANFNHGMTIYNALGGYSNKDLYVIKVVVWSFEEQRYIATIKSEDAHAFISTIKVKNVDGNFRKNIIV